jgi:predicted Zn-dependent protease
MRLRLILSAVLLASLVGCATSPTGRKQMILVDNAAMNKMGVAAFEEVKAGNKLAKDPGTLAYVQCISTALIQALPQPYNQQSWEVALIADDSANAFALPGGKIGVHRGLLKVATDADQLAAVIGHELAHVIARHAAARVSNQMAIGVALETMQAVGEAKNVQQTRTIVGLMGAGATLGVVLPFSRGDESEADILGQRYMAAAGFDPAAASTLWQNMHKASGGERAPKLLSTHPAPQDRLQKLAAQAPSLAATYEAAKAAGKRPNCSTP